MRRKYDIDVDCANCAQKVEDAINRMPEVGSCSISFVNKTMVVEADVGSEEEFDDLDRKIEAAAHRVEDEFVMTRRAAAEGIESGHGRENDEECSCGCGHEHEEHGHGHRHEHEHGEECSCGCGHDHEHEEHEECSCGCGQEAASGPRMRRFYEIDVDCANCAQKVEDAIGKVDGVVRCRINFVQKSMSIEASASSEKEFDEIEKRCEEAAHRAEDEFVMKRRAEPSEAGVMKRTYDIDVDCANCAQKVEDAINGVDGVRECRINFVEKTMVIRAEASSDEEFDAIERRSEDAAHRAEDEFVMARRGGSDSEPPSETEEKEDGPRWLKARIGIGLAALAVGLVIEYGLGDLWSDMNDGSMLYVSTFVYLAIMAFVGYDVYLTVPRNAAKGNLLDEHLLMSIATLGAAFIGLVPEADGVYYIEGLAVMVFYEIGEIFEDRAVDNSRESVKSLMALKAPFATVVRDGKPVEVPPEQVRRGEVLIVKPGDRVPVDGTVVEGESYMDTKAMTGEPVPRRTAVGDEVLSGFINTDGVIRMRADRPYSESATARVIALIEDSSSRKSKSERFITKFARYYTPVVVAGAVLLFLIPPLALDWSWTESLYKALIFLVVSCPCALVVSVPLSYYCGIGRASRQGILVKGSSYVEALSKVDAAVFDKTGTLTKGVFDVVHVHPQGMGEAEFLDLVAHAEAYSTHPIARAIRERAGVEIDTSRLSDVSNIPGQGVTAMVDGRVVYVGNENLMKSQGIESVLDCGHSGTNIHVYVDGAYAGHIVISDALKEGAAEAVTELRAIGVKDVEMLTGDNDAVGRAVSQELRLDGYEAELLPEDKTGRLEAIMKKTGGNTLFVGDGINDSPSIARADVGVAMGGIGSDAAVEAADVVIVDDDPRKVAEAIRIGKHTQGIVWQNIVAALAIKFAVLGLTPFWSGMNMWIAILSDVGVLIAAVLNATRAYRSSGRGGLKDEAPAATSKAEEPDARSRSVRFEILSPSGEALRSPLRSRAITKFVAHLLTVL